VTKIDNRTDLRKLLLSNSYKPLANFDKECRIEDWPKIKIDLALIEKWGRSTTMLSTGIRIEPPLAAIDSDIADQEAQDAVQRAWQDAYPDIFDNQDVPLLQRGNTVNAKLAFFVRCDEAFKRIHTAKWLKPGTVEEDGAHGVEIFGGGSVRQFGVYGAHQRAKDGTELSRYVWPFDTLTDVPLADLPQLTKADMFRLCDLAEAELARLGWTKVLRSQKGETEAIRVYDLTYDMFFDCNDGSRCDLVSLRVAARMDSGLRCSAAWLEGPSAKRTDRCLVGLDHDGGVFIHETASGVTHHEKELDPAGAGDQPLLPPVSDAGGGEVNQFSLPQTTEIALADRFVARNRDIRYVDASGRWFYWTGVVWARDEIRMIRHRVEEVCRSVAARVVERLAKAVATSKTVSSVEFLARSRPCVAATINQWDRDPYLLNCRSVTVDLKDRGQGFQPEMEDYCTKQAAADPGGDAPLWMVFLKRVTRGDPGKLRLLQQIAGYCLIGDPYLQKVFFFHGKGANGKSTFVNTLVHVMGDYAGHAPSEMLMERRGSVHPTELARLHGFRLVAVTEVSAGQAWNETRIKMLSGGEPVVAHFMHHDDFTYMPQFTLIISGNNRPTIRVIDVAIKRRLVLFPFDVVIPEAERDDQLFEKLKAEAGGILHWAVLGAIDLMQNGLVIPAEIIEATEAYLADEDLLQQFIDECPKAPGIEAHSQSLHRDWCQWCADNAGGRNPYESNRAFAFALRDRGYHTHRKTKGVMVLGIGTRGQMAR
jgi:P4 family phage/plasmid primase-like protien